MDEFHWGWDLGLTNFVISLSIILISFILLFFTYYKVIKRTPAYYALCVCMLITILSLIFDAEGGLVMSGVLTALVTSFTLFANLGDVRSFVAAPFKRKNAKAANFGVEKIFDRAERDHQIELAVMHLSKSRIGALITFEKNTSLKDIYKNGVPVHAPVRAELLETIFYSGTRLHDGAVIIHGNEIVAASVFFTPTTKPFAGKYGSRHRAAIGVSEVSDAVTIVVSEETGRISIAVDGELTTIDPGNFLSAFNTFMSVKESEKY